MTTVKNQVQLILDERKKKSGELRERKKNLEEFRDMLKGTLQSLHQETWHIKDEKLRKQYTDIFGKMDAGEVQQALERLLKSMDSVIQRFERDYISIGTVGREGAGKSRFLQSVGNLTDDWGNDVIPSLPTTSCTGATSIIWNDRNVPPHTVTVELSFLSEREFLDFFTPYLVTIDPDYLKNHGSLTLDDIERLDLEDLQETLSKRTYPTSEEGIAYEEIEKIVTHFNEIRPLVGAANRTLHDPKQIKTFVAQHNGKQFGDPEREEYFQYLAVDKANIRCPFLSDIGKVRLVDTVGIGTIHRGAVESMLETVDQECDAAIVVAHPNDRGFQANDKEIYDSLRERFQKRNTKDWLFYLINVFRNEDKVGFFQQTIQTNAYQIAGSVILSVSNQEELERRFMLPMLNTLWENREAINQSFLWDVEEKETAFRNALQKFMRNLAPPLPPVNTRAMRNVEAGQRGRNFFSQRMSVTLRDTVKEWSKHKEETDTTVLWRNVQPILDNFDMFVPSPEKIDLIAKTNGDLTPEEIWIVVLHNVRTAITDKFIEIDAQLGQNIRAFKNSLVKPIYQELRQLSNDYRDIEEDEERDMVEWLKSMLDTALSSKEQYAQIRKGFQFLYEFDFNTRVQLIQEVRRQLYIINPVCDEYAEPEYKFHFDHCGAAIHFYLTSRLAVIEDELRYHLRKIYGAPNMAFYAAAEEFYDRLTFASNLEDGKVVRMGGVWADLFQEYSAELSLSNVEDYEKVGELVQTYNAMIARVSSFQNAAKPQERREDAS